MLGETDLRLTNLSRSTKSQDAVLTKKQVSKVLKKHRKELRMQAAMRKAKKTVTPKVIPGVTDVFLNGIWLPNLSVSSHGPKKTAGRRTPVSKCTKNRDQSLNVEEDEDTAVEITASSAYANGSTPANLIPPCTLHQLPGPGAVPFVQWPQTSWFPWVCNVPGHCHFPQQKLVETPQAPGEVLMEPSATAVAQHTPQECTTKNFNVTDIPRNHAYTYQAADVYYGEHWGASSRENSLNPAQQECSVNHEPEPFTDTSITVGSNSDDQWQSLSAILPYISDRTEYIEETEKEEVEEIHVVDEEVTGDLLSGCETADFILQEYDISPPFASSSSFHHSESSSTEQLENSVEQGSQIQDPQNPITCSCSSTDKNRNVSPSEGQQANNYWRPEHEQVGTSMGGSFVTTNSNLSVSNLHNQNGSRRVGASELKQEYSSQSPRYSNEPRTGPGLLQNKAVIMTNALEILCMLEDEDNAIDTLMSVCKYAKWNPPQFQIAVCTRDDGISPLYRCQISARGNSYGPYGVEKSQTLAKIKAAQECIKELKTGLLKFLHKIK